MSFFRVSSTVSCGARPMKRMTSGSVNILCAAATSSSRSSRRVSRSVCKIGNVRNAGDCVCSCTLLMAPMGTLVSAAAEGCFAPGDEALHPFGGVLAGQDRGQQRAQVLRRCGGSFLGGDAGVG